MQLADVSREDLQLDDTGGPLLLFLIRRKMKGICLLVGRACSWRTAVGRCSDDSRCLEQHSFRVCCLMDPVCCVVLDIWLGRVRATGA